MKNLPLLLFLSLLFSFACSHDHDHSHDGHDDDHATEHDHDAADHGKEYYEYRVYQISNEVQQEKVKSFMVDALIPAYHTQGIETVGAFETINPDKQGYDIHVLVPLDEFDDFEDLYENIYSDQNFLTAGAAYLNEQDPDQKAYDRIKSSLLVAFDSMPQLKNPAGTSDHVFELRSYESFSELKGRKKVAMFDEGGEVTIFTDLGFKPVFFAEALTGDELPNLVYMVTYPQSSDRKSYWDKFGSDPRWVAIKDLPEYAETVSTIHSHMLRAIEGSDIR